MKETEKNSKNPNNLISIDELLENGNIKVIDIGDLVKDLQNILEDYNIDLPRPGLVVKTSRCHNAPVIITKGGIRQEICSKCHQPIQEIRYK